MRKALGIITCVLTILAAGTLHAQRGTIPIPVGAQVTIPAGARVCCDTIIVYGTLSCASTDCICAGATVICIGTVTPASLCSGSGPILAAMQNLAFGTVLVGTSDTLVLVVQNIGTTPLIITATTIAQSGAEFAIISGGGARTIPPGGSAQLAIRFLPGSAGLFSGTLTIQNNSAVPAFDVALSGVGTASGPIVTLSTPRIEFGRVPVGQNGTGSLRVRNTGTAALAITTQRIDGGDSAQFTITESCNGSIAAGQSDDVTVRFTPTGRGAKAARLVFATNAGEASAELTGTGLAPALSVSASTLDFGEVTAGASLMRTLTVTNTGNAVLAISAQTIGGSNASEFSIQKLSAASIDSGASQTVELRFSPSSVGGKTATFTIASNDPSQANRQVALAGRGTSGTQPRIAVAASVEFGNLAAGAAVTRDVGIRDVGTASLSITAQTVQGAGFSIEQNAATGIPAGDSSSARLRFSPATTGDYSGTFSIASSDPSAPTTVVSLHGSCSGSGARIALSRTVINFGTVQVGLAKDESVLLSNVGGSPLILTRQDVIGTDSVDFYILQNAASPIAPGANSTLTVRHRPFTPGQKSATLVLESNDAAMPHFEAALLSNAVVSVERLPQAPSGVLLHQNYPNPFNPSTTIEYEIDQSGEVALALYNAYGEKVRTLDAGMRTDGVYRVTWNATGLPSGVYVAVLRVVAQERERTDHVIMVLAK
jgi:hypothetical protein